MAYCKHCGTALEEQDTFCPNCGRNAKEAERKTTTDKNVFCELAYTGVLFWLPLLAAPEHKFTKICANQGLWVLLLSVFSCWMMGLSEVLFTLCGFGVIGIFVGGLKAFVHMICIFLLLYLAICGIKNAMRIYREEMPKPVLFSEKLKIIK